MILSLRSRNMSLPAAVAVFILLSAGQVRGVTCHCFRDRAFDPARPTAADPYVLASVRNSLVAAASGLEKGKVVRQRMAGASEADIWLGWNLPGELGLGPGALQAARSGTSSWAEALKVLGVDSSRLGVDFTRALREGDEGGMASALADRVMGAVFGLGAHTLENLRKEGAGTAEAALCAFLARRTGRTPESVLREVRDGRSWGSLLHSAGIDLEAVGDLVAAEVRRGRKR